MQPGYWSEKTYKNSTEAISVSLSLFCDMEDRRYTKFRAFIVKSVQMHISLTLEATILGKDTLGDKFNVQTRNMYY